MKICQRISALMLTLVAVTSPQAFEVEKVASGLGTPWGLAYIDANTMLVTQRDGAIKQLDLKT
ncbi:PQQ-dependent sugar dehydrogenase, partial [Shewanella sp. 0m-11]